eukprot:4712818-Pyramimonas_sp.AAC.1
MPDSSYDRIPYEGRDGRKIFVRHPHNKQRSSQAVVKRYAASIEKHGIKKDARSGRVMAVPTTINPDTWVLQ